MEFPRTLRSPPEPKQTRSNEEHAQPSNTDLEFEAVESTSREQDFPLPKLLLRIPEAGRVLGIGGSKMYELLNSGRLESNYIGRSRRVRTSDLKAFVNSNECAR
jgi:excisionase family DNA binding protein